MFPTQPTTRRHGTTREGREFSEQFKLAVWRKAAIAPSLDSGQYRLDSCGAVIAWGDYGLTTHNGNGWEIDHIYPVALGGQDVLGNLQALQWQNNREKGDRTNANYCLIRRSAS